MWNLFFIIYIGTGILELELNTLSPEEQFFQFHALFHNCDIVLL